MKLIFIPADFILVIRGEGGICKHVWRRKWFGEDVIFTTFERCAVSKQASSAGINRTPRKNGSYSQWRIIGNGRRT